MNKPVATISKPVVRPAQLPITKAKDGGERDVAGEPANQTGITAPALSETITPLIDEMLDGTNRFFDVKDVYITIVGDTVKSGHIIGLWDTALTVCGSFIFTPPTVETKSDPSELELGDFAVNVKIRKSSTLIVITNENGEIPSYMFPWIDFAFARGKEVIIDQPTIPSDTIITFRTNGLIRELRGHLITREAFIAYTKGKLD